MNEASLKGPLVGFRLHETSRMDQSIQAESRQGAAQGWGWGPGARLPAGTGPLSQGPPAAPRCACPTAIATRCLGITLLIRDGFAEPGETHTT